MTGDGLSDRELSDYSELIKREVSELDGVERVDLYGNRPECINISLLQDRMANLGVKPAEVLATLNGQNKTTYTGYYDNGDSRIRVTVSDKFKTVEDIGRMLIQGHDADQLRLSDIARIEKTMKTPPATNCSMTVSVPWESWLPPLPMPILSKSANGWSRNLNN